MSASLAACPLSFAFLPNPTPFWLWRHESGTYLKLTDSGAALFA
jgi:hypothetical protein